MNFKCYLLKASKIKILPCVCMFVPILILTHPSALFPLEAVKRKAALKYSPRPTDPSIIISSLLDTEMVSDYNFRIVLDSHSIILQYCHVSLKMQKRKSNKTPYFPHPPPHTHIKNQRQREHMNRQTKFGPLSPTSMSI